MEFLQSLIFYKWQILQAIMLGVLLSASGTLVVLRREAVFGLLATQAAVLARIAIHMLGISYMDNYVSMLVSLFLCAPFYFLARRAEHASAILLGGVLCFSAAAELLAALGHFRMHLLQSYFGNFLISEPQSLWITLALLCLLLVAGLLYYPKILFISLNREQACAMRLPVVLIELGYFCILVLIYSWSIQIAGSIFSLAQSILPAIAVLLLSRNFIQATLFAILLSVLANSVGFGLSLISIEMDGSTLFLPSSSVMVLVLCILSGLVWWAGHRNLMVLAARKTN